MLLCEVLFLNTTLRGAKSKKKNFLGGAISKCHTEWCYLQVLCKGVVFLRINLRVLFLYVVLRGAICKC